MKNTKLIEWKEKVKQHNIELTDKLKNNSEIKDLHYGFEVFDGKLIDNPRILFIGINPGRGNGEYGKDTFETEQISYLDIFDENYRDDYPNKYHLAEKIINFFRLIGWDDTKIQKVLSKEAVKTNFYHLATENIADLNRVLSNINYSKKYFRKSAEFSIQLINLLKPKVVILEGKSVFEFIVGQCYEKNGWSDNNYGYYFDEKNNSHIIGFSRARNFTNENRSHFVKKLKEIL